MGDPGQRERELLDLLSAGWDDRLDGESRQRLEQLLAENEFEQVPLLVEFSRLHLDLEWIASSRAAQRKAMAAVARAKGDSQSPGARRFGMRRAMGLAAAAMLAAAAVWGLRTVAIGVRNWGAPGDAAGVAMMRPSLPVGRLEFGRNVQMGGEGGGELVNGQTLLEGQTVDVTGGSVRVSMNVGAEIAILGPCRLTLVDGDTVALHAGRIEVRVATWVRDFQVKTDDLAVTDLGTRFMVNADAPLGSEVYVLEGIVLASHVQRPDAIRRLGAQDAVRATAAGGLEDVPWVRSAFGKELDTFRPLRPLIMPNTGMNVRVGEKDAHWRITAGDDSFGPYPQEATVGGTDEIHGLNEAQRSQWISVEGGMTRGAPVRSRYSYETTFDLSGYDPKSVRLTGLILADNGVEEIRLNGQLLPVAPWLDWYFGVKFVEFHSIDIAGGFAPGKNVLSIVVTNEVDLPPPDNDVELPESPNAMGLRVEWQGAGRPL